MASISKDASGNRTIQFVGKDKKRRSVRLGKCSQRQAEAVKVQLERLVHASLTGHPADSETSRWLTLIDGQLADRLAAVGLIPKREAATLKGFIDAYMVRRTDVKSGTQMNYDSVRRNLLEFFPDDKPLASFTPADADALRLFLKEKGLAENTVRRRLGRARQFFTAAIRAKLLTDNPFADLKVSVQGNPERFYFLSKPDAAKVLDACPSAEWRAIFALSRFGGLRCPSEHIGLRWGDIDWANNRIHVKSPKTEHHIGGESRWLPLFPELRPHLEALFDESEEGSEFVITRYRDAKQNLRTTFEKIIVRAGLKPWPKLFQNLRSTRETELAERFPIHVVCAWIGNSEPVASKHYLQVTDEHFMLASEAASEDLKWPTNATQEAVQNPVQQAHETARNDSKAVNSEKAKASKSAGDCEALPLVALNASYPTRTRTWNSRTKICCVADYTIG